MRRTYWAWFLHLVGMLTQTSFPRNILRIAKLRGALVLGLSERGELEYRDAWTNRELLERGSPRRDVAPILAGLVPRLDAQSFGHEPAGPADVENLSSLCDRLLGRIPA